MFGAASFFTLQVDLVTPRTHFCGLPASMGRTVQTVCNATYCLATYPVFYICRCFLFSWRQNSPNITFTTHSCPIQRHLVHSHVAQPPPLLSFETLSTPSKTTLHLPGSHSPLPSLPETPILRSVSMVFLFWIFHKNTTQFVTFCVWLVFTERDISSPTHAVTCIRTS